MARTTRTSRSLLALASLTLLTGALRASGLSAQPWPDEALWMVPADPVVVVATPSVESLERSVVDLLALLDPAAAAGLRLEEAVRGWAGGHLVAMDPGRPMLFTLHLSEGRGATSPVAIAFVFALAPGEEPRGDLDAFPITGRRGEWVTVSSSAELVPAVGGAPLLDSLPVGDVVARADVATLAVTFGPVVEMGLTLALSQTEGAAVPPGQRETVLAMTRLLMSEVATLELTLAGDDESIEMAAALDLRPGSELAAPPEQPSREDAWDLARALPPTDSFHHVAAVDLTPWNEAMRPSWEAWLEPLVDDADGRGGIESVVDRLFTLVDLYRLPNAASLGLEGDSLRLTHIVQARDARRLRDGLERAFADDSPARLPLTLRAEGDRELDGWSVRTYAVGFDAVAMSAIATGAHDSLSSDHAAPQMDALLRGVAEWLPPLRIAVREPLLVAFLGPDRDSESGVDELASLLARLDAPGDPPRALEQARSWAGEDARVVASLDVAAFFDDLATLAGLPRPERDVHRHPSARLQMAMAARGDRLEMRLRLPGAALHWLAEASTIWATPAEQDVGEEPGAESAEVVEDGEPGTGTGRGEIGEMTEQEIRELAASLLDEVEELRGHAFLHEVPVRVVDDEEAATYFVRRMTESMPPEWIRAYQDALIDLQLLPAGTDLEATLFELLEEQAGGFYDPQSGVFFLLDDMPRATASLIIVHELTHALDDQHFDLDALLLEDANTDDERTAAGAVVEGSGTLVMTRFLMEEMMAGRMSQADLLAFQQSEAGRAEVLQRAPRALQRGLLAPYLLGNRFLLKGNVATMAAGPDPEDVDRAFRDPPLSTEQVLHPLKYWEEESLDPPRTVVLPDLSEIAGPGWSRRWSGELGELDLALLTQPEGEDPGIVELAMGDGWTNEGARGWDGDAWILLEQDDRTVTVLAIVWDDAAEAAEFDSVYAPPAGTVVRREGDRVVVVAGELPERAADLAEAALARMEVED